MPLLTQQFSRLSFSDPPAFVFTIAWADDDETMGESWIALPHAPQNRPHVFRRFFNTQRGSPEEEMAQLLKRSLEGDLAKLCSLPDARLADFEPAPLLEVDVRAWRSLAPYPGLPVIIRETHSAEMSRCIQKLPQAYRTLFTDAHQYP